MNKTHAAVRKHILQKAPIVLTAQVEVGTGVGLRMLVVPVVTCEGIKPPLGERLRKARRASA